MVDMRWCIHFSDGVRGKGVDQPIGTDRVDESHLRHEARVDALVNSSGPVVQ